MGIVIRAGVDDQAMVRALGININVVFAVTFFVGAFLAGMGGAMGASFAGVAPGADGQWLLNSLVVVIIGGLGSIKGAAAGSLLYGMVVAFSPAYLPTEYTFYAIIFTFVLLAIVLAVRPYGLFGQAGMSGAAACRAWQRDIVVARRARCADRLCRPFGSDFFVDFVDDSRADPRPGRVDDRLPVRLRRDGVARSVALVWRGRFRRRQLRR